MNPQRIVGIALLVLGVTLLIFGISASGSFADQLSKTFTGRFTEQTTWYLIGGIVSGIVGASMLVLGGRGHKA